MGKQAGGKPGRPEQRRKGMKLRLRLPPPRILRLSEESHAGTIMIGPLRGPAHLELIRREGYYHVPVSAIAADRSGVETIAFYEAASRFGEPGAIRHFAQVRQVRQVPRRALPGLSWPGRYGDDTLYYRFDLGPLLSLTRPILNPERRRVVFQFSDLDRLRQAETLRDLRRVERPRPRRDARAKPKEETR